MRRGPMAVLAVVLLVVLGIGLGETGRGARPGPGGSRTAAVRPVDTAVRVCPLTRYEPGRTGNYFAVAALGDSSGTGADPGMGTVTATVLPDARPAAPAPSASATPSAAATPSPSATPSSTPSAPSVLASAGTANLHFGPAKTNDATTVVEADGALAPGLDAEMFTRGEAGAERGIASTVCAEPSTESWFVGASTVVDAGARLVLANPADADAVVDITFYGPDGMLRPSAGRGLTVPARTRSVIPLESLAPDVKWLAVAVRTRTGRVAAAVEQHRGSADEPHGVDWIPRAEAPGRRVVVAGVPGGLSAYTLLVANPGQTQADVSVQTATTDGQFTPVGLDSVQVPAESVVAVDATAALRSGPSSVVLTSNGDVVASVSLTARSSANALREIGYAGQAQPLTEPGVLAFVRGLPNTTDSLLLTAEGGDVTATVRPLQVVGENAPPAPRSVTVPTGRTVELVLSDILGPGGALPVEIVSSGRGRLYAAQSLVEQAGRGMMVTGHPVLPGEITVTQPGVVADLGVSLPRPAG